MTRSILNTLLYNLGIRPLTYRPGDRVPAPDRYRGSLQHDLTRCTGCATCAYVCSPAAIMLNRIIKPTAWHYDASQCTFCGRCAEFCPTHALDFSTEPLPATGDRAQYILVHSIEQRACDRCGQPMTPLPRLTLIRLYGEPLPAEITTQQALCETCRSRLASESIKRGHLGQRKPDGH
jgi:hydrogenase-4 component H